MEPTIDCLVDLPCELGENPYWHPDEGRFYWTDITRGQLYYYDFATGEHRQFYEGETVGGFTLQADGALLLFMPKGAVRTWKNGVLETVLEGVPEEHDSRFNDVIADPHGRVFCGTIESDTHPGALYRLDPDGSLTKVAGGVGTSNGLGFSLDHKKMYYIDSPKQFVYCFDYDEKTGAISNRQDFIAIPESLGTPDGMTVDAEGYLWVAIWGGGCLIRFSPEGKEVLRLVFPAKKVSSVTFGGPDYEDVFVTTAGGENRAEEGPGAGAIFHFRPGVRGLPEFRSRIKIP
jgi:D-xylonolactonase